MTEIIFIMEVQLFPISDRKSYMVNMVRLSPKDYGNSVKQKM